MQDLVPFTGQIAVVVSLGLVPGPDTGGSQFFFVTGPKGLKLRSPVSLPRKGRVVRIPPRALVFHPRYRRSRTVPTRWDRLRETGHLKRPHPSPDIRLT